METNRPHRQSLNLGCSWAKFPARPPLFAGGSLTFVCIGEGSSERAPHPDVPVLEVFQHEMLHWDWLPVNLEALALVPGDVARQNQQLGEQEHVQLLRGSRERNINQWLMLCVGGGVGGAVGVLYSRCHSCSEVHRDTADSCTGRCERLAAARPDTQAGRCSSDTLTLPSSC